MLRHIIFPCFPEVVYTKLNPIFVSVSTYKTASGADVINESADNIVSKYDTKLD
jgi:hypothetical protein